MISVLLQSLSLASVGLISPGSITLVILLLMSDQGWRNGVAFMLGYLCMYALIGASVLTLGMNALANRPSPIQEGQSMTASLILIGLGLLLLMLSLRNWRKKSEAERDGQPSRFIKLVEGITPLKSFALAAAISMINLKNLTIFLSAVSVLLFSQLLLAIQLTILIPLVLLFCTSVILPVAIYFLFPGQANERLNRIKDGISLYSRPLGIAVTLILGTVFLYRGITGL